MLPDLFPNQTPTFAKRANRFGSTKTPKQRGKYLLEHGWPLFPAGMDVDNSCVSTLSSRCLHFQCAFPQLPVQGARWRHLALHSADSCTLPVGTSSETLRTEIGILRWNSNILQVKIMGIWLTHETVVIWKKWLSLSAKCAVPNMEHMAESADIAWSSEQVFSHGKDPDPLSA